MQTEEVTLPNNPFVPPKGDVCFIKKLPVKLLARVFELGAAEDDDSDDEDEDTNNSAMPSDTALPGHRFPAVTSCVCRDWHTVAYATAALWTTIVITNRSASPYLRETTLLARSRDLPVDIYLELQVDEYGEGGGPSDADLMLLFSILVGHIHRWRTVEIVSECKYMSTFVKALSNPSIPAAPRLETLKLCCYDDEDEDDFIFPTIIQHHYTLFSGLAPSLTTIILSGVHVNWDQPWIASIPNVTDLRFALHSSEVCPSWAQFATILRGASSLRRLALDRSGPAEWVAQLPPGSAVDPNSPIELPRLTDLILGRHSADCAIELIQMLRLPALKNLVIDVGQDDFIEFVLELIEPSISTSPMERERPSLLRQLESLTLGSLWCEDDYDAYDDMEDACIERFYSELKNLKTLKIAASSVESWFLGILSMPCQSGDDMWLPKLKELYVSGANGHRIREVVQGRKEMGFSLRTLHVANLGMEDMAWLRRKVRTVKVFNPKRWGVPWIDQAEM